MNSLSLHCFKSPNFHLSKQLFVFLSPPQKRHFVLKSCISIYSEFDIGMPQLVSLTCRKKDKRNIYTTKLSAGLRTGSRWEKPSFWCSVPLPFCPGGARTPNTHIVLMMSQTQDIFWGLQYHTWSVQAVGKEAQITSQCKCDQPFPSAHHSWIQAYTQCECGHALHRLLTS